MAFCFFGGEGLRGGRAGFVGGACQPVLLYKRSLLFLVHFGLENLCLFDGFVPHHCNDTDQPAKQCFTYPHVVLSELCASKNPGFSHAPYTIPFLYSYNKYNYNYNKFYCPQAITHVMYIKYIAWYTVHI